MDITSWALPKLQSILQLDEQSVQQIIEYSLSLSHEEAAQNLKALLGDTPRALEFINSFNSRRSVKEPASRQQLPSKAPSNKPSPAAGYLVSDSLNGKKPSRRPAASKAKIVISGGPSMHGQSSILNDLDSAIRALEIQTNPSLSAADDSKRRCNCNATRHPLLAAAPNCTYCGKIVCVKEGIGPCTFCKHPLLKSEDIQSMMSILKAERGRERMEANNALHRRTENSRTPRSHSPTKNGGKNNISDSDDVFLAQAKEHRNKLLSFQANNTKRTKIIDEAADFETPASGQSIWASPSARAAQLRQQQKVLRELEWNAKPEYEKRRMMISLDVAGGKVVKTYRKVDISRESESESENEDELTQPRENDSGTASHALKELTRPVWRNKSEVKESDENTPTGHKRQPNLGWRRVQDEFDDEGVLLNDRTEKD